MSELESKIDEEGVAVYIFGEANDEYVQVEAYDGYFSMAWTTRSLANVISLLHDNIETDFPKEKASGIILLAGSSRHKVATAATTVDICSNKTHDVTFARVDFPELALTWRAGRKFSNGNPDPTQCGLIADKFDSEFIEAILARTGTGEVAAHASQLTEAARFLERKIPAGRIGELGDWRET
ncbi:hypothetical protein AB0D14_27560 [Streptomyces sp. NPDC048484]|uniref:hypothetical protein n=1 Tax=Streptomyces sp. NPDC048484 TaxID=3155146 RepID=UPI003443AB91